MAKAYEELELKDDFMFSVIMRDPKYVKPFLETILRIKIAKIEYPVLPALTAKSTRTRNGKSALLTL